MKLKCNVAPWILAKVIGSFGNIFRINFFAVNCHVKYRAIEKSCLCEDMDHYKYDGSLYLPLYVNNE